MQSPSDFIGKRVKDDITNTAFKIITDESAERVVYCARFEPEVGTAEHGRLHDLGAAAYEVYLICQNQTIEETNLRIEQLPCSRHSHAPHAAPAWMFPEGAMFDIEWEDIVASCRKQITKAIGMVIVPPSSD